MPPRGGHSRQTPSGGRSPTGSLRCRSAEAERNAGDPGVVLARRLSNAEYNYTVQDLTGVGIAPTKAFPVDPANEAGFDNSGETLAISPALLTSYIDAARNVADHIVFQPHGFSFAPHEVVTETDRDRFVVNRIMDFHRRQRTDLADYFFALWRYENRSALGLKGASLARLPPTEGLSLSLPQRLQQLQDAQARSVQSPGCSSAGTRCRQASHVRRRDRARRHPSAPRLRRRLPEEAWLEVRGATGQAAARRLRDHGDARQSAGGLASAAAQPAGAPRRGRGGSAAKGYDADLVVPSDPRRGRPPSRRWRGSATSSPTRSS